MTLLSRLSVSILFFHHLFLGSMIWSVCLASYSLAQPSSNNSVAQPEASDGLAFGESNPGNESTDSHHLDEGKPAESNPPNPSQVRPVPRGGGMGFGMGRGPGGPGGPGFGMGRMGGSTFGPEPPPGRSPMSIDQIIESPAFRTVFQLMQENAELKSQMKIQAIQMEARMQVQSLQHQMELLRGQLEQAKESLQQANVYKERMEKRATELEHRSRLLEERARGRESDTGEIDANAPRERPRRPDQQPKEDAADE